MVRAGHTEAAVDLARLAGLAPAGVICEVLKKDGSMARVPDLVPFARRHGLLLITIADLIQYRMAHERLVRRVASAKLPTEFGDFQLFAYESVLDGETHVALVRGEIGSGQDVMVRVHSKCLTGDVFHSARCDCGPQLHTAMQRIAAENRGVLAVPEPGRPRHRPREQDPRVRAAGPGLRHGRSQRASRVQAGPARLRHRRPDSRRPRGQDDAAAHEQPAQVRRSPGLRTRREGVAPARDPRVGLHAALPEDKEGKARAQADGGLIIGLQGSGLGPGPWLLASSSRVQAPGARLHTPAPGAWLPNGFAGVGRPRPPPDRRNRSDRTSSPGLTPELRSVYDKGLRVSGLRR